MYIKKALCTPLLPLFAFLFLLYSESIPTAVLTETRDAYLSFVVLQVMTFLLPTVFFCKIKGENYIFQMKFKPFGLEKVLFLFFAVCVMITSMTVMELILSNTGIAGGAYTHNVFRLYGRSMPELGSNVYDSLYMVIVFALVPAVIEELLFRSVLYTEYECCGAPSAIVLTAFLYGLLDMSAVSFLPAFVGGLLLGFSVYITGSVFAPMLIHFIYNMYAMFFREYVWAYVSKPENTAFFTLLSVGGLLLFGGFMFVQAKRVLYAKGLECEPIPAYLTEYKQYSGSIMPGIRSFLVSVISPAYLLCLGVFLFHIIRNT